MEEKIKELVDFQTWLRDDVMISYKGIDDSFEELAKEWISKNKEKKT